MSGVCQGVTGEEWGVGKGRRMSFLRMKKCECSANVLLHFRCAKEKCIKYETNAVWT